MNNKVRIASFDREPALNEGERVHAVLFSEETSREFTFVWRRLSANKPLGIYHGHRRAENLIIVLEGTMEAIVGGERYLVHKNEAIFMPANVPHTTGNGGDTELQAIEIYAPYLGEGNNSDRYDAELPADLPDGDPIRVSIPTADAVARPPKH